jgi:cell division protein FtsZ
VEEATKIIQEASGEEANVILGAVIDDQMTDEIMVTVIATGFNRRATPTVGSIRQPKQEPRQNIEKIPTGYRDLVSLDEPAYVRHGVALDTPQQRAAQAPVKERIDKSDHEKPAFLRKVMD